MKKLLAKEIESFLEMAVESEKKIALVQANIDYSPDLSAKSRGELEQTLESVQMIHDSVRAVYEKMSGQKFDSKIERYREAIRKKLSQ